MGKESGKEVSKDASIKHDDKKTPDASKKRPGAGSDASKVAKKDVGSSRQKDAADSNAKMLNSFKKEAAAGSGKPESKDKEKEKDKEDKQGASSKDKDKDKERGKGSDAKASSGAAKRSDNGSKPAAVKDRAAGTAVAMPRSSRPRSSSPTGDRKRARAADPPRDWASRPRAEPLLPARPGSRVPSASGGGRSPPRRPYSPPRAPGLMGRR